MGKGDRKTRKGKINIGSHGNKRPPGPHKALPTKPVAKSGAARKSAHK